MLYLVGIGLKPKHLTLEALDILKNCDQVFTKKKYSNSILEQRR
jgi:precorrin-2 methylase